MGLEQETAPRRRVGTLASVRTESRCITPGGVQAAIVQLADVLFPVPSIGSVPLAVVRLHQVEALRQTLSNAIGSLLKHTPRNHRADNQGKENNQQSEVQHREADHTPPAQLRLLGGINRWPNLARRAKPEEHH